MLLVCFDAKWSHLGASTIIFSKIKNVDVEIEWKSGPKFDSKNLHRAKSIHYHSNNNNSNNNNNGSQESRNETRKASLPHITISSPIVRPELFKKKPKKGLFCNIQNQDTQFICKIFKSWLLVEKVGSFLD